MRHVLVVGINNTDTFLISEEDFTGNGKKIAKEMYIIPGGMAANVAYFLGMLGVHTHYFGAFGNDVNGKNSRTSLEEVNVDVDHCPTVDCPNGCAIVDVNPKTGNRTAIIYQNQKLSLRENQLDPSKVSNASYVFTDGHQPEVSLSAAKLAKNLGIPVLADAESVNDFIITLLPFVDYLIAPDDVILELGKKSSIEESLEVLLKDHKAIIATKGDKGCVGIFRGNQKIFIPADSVSVVDSTGAGDAFHAGFIYGLVQSLSFQDSLNFATHLAGMTCEVAGARLKKSDWIEKLAKDNEASHFMKKYWKE